MKLFTKPSVLLAVLCYAGVVAGQDCAFNSLNVVPASAGVTGVNCTSGGTVTSPGTCGVSLTGYTCSAAVCNAGAWSGGVCTANQCNNGPSGGIPSGYTAAAFVSCNTLTTGMSCTTYDCGLYHHPIAFVVTCSAAGTYDASASSCDPNACTAGPFPAPDPGYPTELHGGTQTVQTGTVPGTPIPAAGDWSACNALTTGQTCPGGTGFSCSAGWTASGTLTLQCDASGNYNASGAVCTPNTCTAGPTSTPANTNAGMFTYCNGLVSGIICEQTEVMYASQGYLCDPGYFPTGDFKLICDAAGNYATTGASCIKMDCMSGPYNMPNNTQKANFVACDVMDTNDVCRAGTDWTCDPGYTPMGDITLVCTGTYDMTGAQCVPNTCTGGPSATPANTNAGNFGGCSAKVSGEPCNSGGYSCDTGYTAVVEFTLICDASGNYDASAGSCVAKPCNNGPVAGSIPSGASINGFQSCNQLAHGATCSTVQCDTGYDLSGTLVMACTPQAYYTVSGITCTPTPCSGGPITSTLPENSTAAGFAACTGMSTGMTCSYTCDTGYGPVGTLLLACNSTGYSAVTAQCLPTDPCDKGPILSTVPSTTTADRFDACTTLISTQTCTKEMFSCMPGYTSTTDLVLECVGGYFNVSTVTCTPNPCNSGPTNPPFNSNDFSSCNALTSGETCSEYTCQPGYTTGSSFVLQCDAAGAYQSYGSCIGNPCGNGPNTGSVPANSVATRFEGCNNMRSGDTCRAQLDYRCNPGFRAVGDITLQCTAGKYDVTGASCVPMTCSVGTDCNGNALSVMPHPTEMNTCLCECRNGWSGANCGLCSAPFAGADCNQCHTSAVGYPACTTCSLQLHCNGNANSVAPNALQTGCVCSCAAQWTGEQCDTCPTKYDQIACNSCAAGLVQYPSCVTCTSATHCNGRASSVAPTFAQDGCTCACVNRWVGDACQHCPDPYGGSACNTCATGYIGTPPNCVKCTIDVSCSRHASSVTSSGGSCVCTCDGNWSGADCSSCDVKYNQVTCSGCNTGYVGATCRACDASADCNGKGLKVTSDSSNTQCHCTECKDKWEGATCATCPTQYGAGCNTCAVGRVGFPTCNLCTVTGDCSNHATSVTSDPNTDACVCTCAAQWEGPQCNNCKLQYDSLTCDRCAAGHIGYPNCVLCTSAVHCNGRAASGIITNAERTLCICQTCTASWTGDSCGACQHPHNASAGCAACLTGYISYPKCVECTTATHCSDHASSVVSNTDQTACTCTCSGKWQGNTCNTCIDIYDQTTCDKCADGYIGYPDCTQCQASACNNHGSLVGSNTDRTACECNCRNQWSGAGCLVCPEAYGGVDCDRCSAAGQVYPACGISVSTAAPDTDTPSRDTPSPVPPMTQTPASLCDTVVCTQLDQCHMKGTCNPLTGVCNNPTQPNGTPCSDGDLDTANDTCLAGVCLGAIVCGGTQCSVNTDPSCRVAMCDGSTGSPTCSVRLLSGKQCNDNLPYTWEDTCVAGTCVGVNRPCTEIPNVPNGVVMCSGDKAFGETCAVTGVAGYECEGTVACTRETTPMFDAASVTCMKKATMCDLSIYTTIQFTCSQMSDGDVCSASCKTANGAVQGVSVRCAAGTVTGLPDCVNMCDPKGFTRAGVTCDRAVTEGAHCELDTTCTGEVLCLGGVHVVRTPVTCTGPSLSCDTSTTVIPHGTLDSTTLVVTPAAGYSCTGSVTCNAGNLVNNAVCVPITCEQDHLVVAGVCYPCSANETRANSDPVTGPDTYCAPPNKWTDVATNCEAQLAVVPMQEVHIVRLVLGTAIDYVRFPMREMVCEFLRGNRNTVDVLYGSSVEGPWVPRENATSLRPYDTRPQPNTLQCCNTAFTGSLTTGTVPNGVAMYMIAKSEQPTTPDMSGAYLIRVFYNKPLEQLRRATFVKAIAEVLQDPWVKGVTIEYGCPEEACPKGVCPGLVSERLAKGCKFGDNLPQARGGVALQGGGSYVDFDMWFDLLQTSEGVDALREAAIVKMIADLELPANTSVLHAAGISEPARVDRPMSVSPMPAVKDDDDGNGSLGVVFYVLFPILLVGVLCVGVLLWYMSRRKKKLDEQADQEEEEGKCGEMDFTSVCEEPSSIHSPSQGSNVTSIGPSASQVGGDVKKNPINNLWDV
eukprot:TRINITY_DN8740_c0_g1_i1.p1 TRINITY_DN8740_c0_g1~~TRINITY_DN8740_c0_g1_i1.p1  ORF type:complete len:2130 (+),score=388.50 TRINITY_DN8740_c0_g1_i1:56-6445(+)